MTVYAGQGNAVRGVIDPVYAHGADPTGTTDATSAILSSITDALGSGVTISAGGAGSTCRYLTVGVHMSPGVYLINSAGGLDFSTVLIANSAWSVSAIRNFQFVCDPGVIFVQGAALTSGNVINIDAGLSGGGQGQILNSTIKLGHVIGRGGSGGSSANLVQVRNFTNGHLSIEELTAADANGIWFNSQASTYGTFNNDVRIRDIQFCGSSGLALDGQSRTNPIGIQGNVFYVNEIYGCVNGVAIDSVYGTGGNTSINRFEHGVIEHNSASGIFDKNGGNAHYVANTNSNTTAGYYLATGAHGQPYVRGYLADTTPYTLNGGTADIVSHPIS